MIARQAKAGKISLQWHVGLNAENIDMIERLDHHMVLAGPDADRSASLDCRPHATFDILEGRLMERLGIPRIAGVLSQAVTTPFHDWIQGFAATAPRLADFDDGYGFVAEIESNEGEPIGLGAFLGDHLDHYHLRGLLFGSELAVARPMQGFGLGRALVAAQLLHHGELPTWRDEAPAYSSIGAGCAAAGLVMAQRVARAHAVDINLEP